MDEKAKKKLLKQIAEVIKEIIKEEYSLQVSKLEQRIDDVLLGQEQIKAKLDRLEHKLDLIHNSLGINKTWSTKRIAKG